jgi:hypothetical protein
MLDKPLKIRFKHNKKPVKLVVMPASYEIEQRLKTVYAVAYRKCIKQGVATRPAMIKLMEEEGLWDGDREQELTNLSIELGLLEAALSGTNENEVDEQREREVAIRLAATRSKVYELVSIKTLPLEHTAEAIADDVQVDNYIALCTFIDDDTCSQTYFRDHADLMRRRNDVDVQKIFAAMEEEMNRESLSMLMELPEHKWLVARKYMDKQGNFLNPDVEEKIVEESEVGSSTVVDELVKK